MENIFIETKRQSEKKSHPKDKQINKYNQAETDFSPMFEQDQVDIFLLS